MISVILVSWKGHMNAASIVSELSRSRLVGEIFLWNNNPWEVEFEGATVIQSPKNFFTLPRYCLVPLALWETIWTQDDDILVTSEQLEVLWAAYQKDRSLIYGVVGRTLRDGRIYDTRNVPPGRCDEVIRAQLFHRSQIGPMFSMLPTVHWTAGIRDVADEDSLYLNLARGLGRSVVVDVGPVRDLWGHLTGRYDRVLRRQEAVNDILEKLRGRDDELRRSAGKFDVAR